MPIVDFDTIPDLPDFSPIPGGWYKGKIIFCDKKETNAGAEMWAITIEIIDGENKNRKIFDNLIFSSKCISRTKVVLGRLGLNTKGKRSISPDMIIGRETLVETYINDYVDKNGQKKKNNKVTFAGYQPLEKVKDAQGLPPNIPQWQNPQSQTNQTGAEELPF